jgi:hypothetical protein
MVTSKRPAAAKEAATAIFVPEEPTTLEELAPEAPETFTIGPASAPMTPGWLMGIGSRPETAAEHIARLGTAAARFPDIGWTLGTLKGVDGSMVAPVITFFQPHPLSKGGGAKPGAIYGDHFDDTCVLTVGGATLTNVVVVDSGEISFTINPAALTVGSVNAVVTKGSYTSVAYPVQVVA